MIVIWSQAWWPRPVIPAFLEAEAGGSEVQGLPGQLMTLSQDSELPSDPGGLCLDQIVWVTTFNLVQWY